MDEKITMSKKVKFGGKGVEIKQRSLFGRDYNVVPATIIKEGTFFPSSSSPSDGGVFISGGVLEASSSLWNGRGISLNHPDNPEGSLNSPDAFDRHCLGFIFNSNYSAKEKAIKTEFWLDSDRAEDIIARLNRQEEIDVSIGGFGHYQKQDGFFQGSKYGLKLEDISPDHVAILPDSKGACSYKYGCGIRAELYDKASQCNNLQEGEVLMGDKDQEKEKRDEAVGCDDVVRDMSSLLAKADSSLRKVIEEKISLADSMRASMIDKINEVSAVRFCDGFLDSVSMKDLRSISILADMANKKNEENKERQIEREKVSDFSLNASKHQEENKIDYAEIKDLDLG